MLVLTRKQGESIKIGDDIEIVITEINKGSARIGILAPKDMPVYRSEIYDRILQENQTAADLNIHQSDFERLNSIISNTLKKAKPSVPSGE